MRGSVVLKKGGAAQSVSDLADEAADIFDELTAQSDCLNLGMC